MYGLNSKLKGYYHKSLNDIFLDKLSSEIYILAMEIQILPEGGYSHFKITKWSNLGEIGHILAPKSGYDPLDQKFELSVPEYH